MTNGKILVAFFVALLAVAITGKTTPAVGVHPDCFDGIDNDSNGQTDWDDGNCEEYPFEDGGGEYLTTYEKLFASERYAYSVWEVHYIYFADYYGATDLDWCAGFNDPAFSHNVNFYSGYDQFGDTSVQDYTDWEAANCP